MSHLKTPGSLQTDANWRALVARSGAKKYIAAEHGRLGRAARLAIGAAGEDRRTLRVQNPGNSAHRHKGGPSNSG